uniref:Putative NADH dehydrogenase n=2 Tax=viral metagenome TaxID=1070528 RepID=A0A6H1ZUS5_9ZZZZ
MKILFIGGNGNISWYCIQEAIRQRHEVWMLHRGATTETRRKTQPEVTVLHADTRDYNATKRVLGELKFDVVIDFICYNKEQAQFDIRMFENITDQFVFISTTSVYERESINLPYREGSPKDLNSIREYTRNKLKAERAFRQAYTYAGFPVVIIRPCYTYDTIIPVSCGLNDWTVAQRILDGKPPIILGDGSNLFTFTHSKDFASALIPLCEHPDAVGEVFNITGDEVLNWKEATNILCETLGVKTDYLYIPTEYVCRYLERMNPIKTKDMVSDFRSQKMWSDVFNNDKIKRFVPGWNPDTTLRTGLRETIDWMHGETKRKRIDPVIDELLDGLTERFVGMMR